MKYIKTFEMDYTNPGKYNIGDYVHLKKTDFYDLPEILLPYAKILNAETYKYYPPDYKCESISKKNNDIIEMYPIDELDIDRYMSDDEIDEYEALKKSTKYNL